MCLPKQPKSFQTVAGAKAVVQDQSGVVTTSSTTKAATAAATATNNSFQKEEYDDPSTFITNVSPDDVVLGRGAGPNEMAGNIAFRQVVAQFKPSYVATVNRKAKSQIAHKVVQTIKSKRGRFLRRAVVSQMSSSSSSTTSTTSLPDVEQDIFVEAEEEVILEKTKQALRYGKRENRRSWTSGLSMTQSPSQSSTCRLDHDMSTSQITGVKLSTSSSRSLSFLPSPHSAATAAPIVTAVGPEQNQCTAAFLLQRLQRESQVGEDQQQRIPSMMPAFLSSSTSNPFTSYPTVITHRQAIPTDSSIIDEALSTSVRDSSSDEQIVQLLIDKAIAVRHESPRASTRLLDLVESLIGQQQQRNHYHKAAPNPIQSRSRIIIPPTAVAATVLAPLFEPEVGDNFSGSSLQTKTVTPSSSSSSVVNSISNVPPGHCTTANATVDAAKILAAFGIYMG